MRNDIELFLIKHGAYWAVALVAVAISKLYSRDRHTFKSVLKSSLAALTLSFILVEMFDGKVAQSTIFAYVFIASILTDVIVEVIMGLGVRIKEDPSLLAKFLPWGGKK